MNGRRLVLCALLVGLLPLLASSSIGTAASTAAGDKVVFAGFLSSGGSSYLAVNVMSPDGTGRRAITPRKVPADMVDPATSGGFADDLRPATVALSPDGQTLAFATDRPNFDCCGRRPIDGELLVVRIDGSGLRRLTTTASRDESRPLFSPNGKRIAFLQNAGLDRADFPKLSLAVINSDGTDLRVIAGAKPRASDEEVQVSWHPDSNRLLFYPGPRFSGEPPEHSFLIDVTSGARKTVYGGPAQFSPDGKEVGLFWGGELYVGSLAAFTKRDFARRVRPRVSREYSKRAALLTMPFDIVWLGGGRILYAAHDLTKRCPTVSSAAPSAASLLGVVDRSGARKVIGREACATGSLVAPSAPTQVLWLAGSPAGRWLAASPVGRWSPHALRNLSYTSVAFGYQSVLECGGDHGTGC